MFKKKVMIGAAAAAVALTGAGISVASPALASITDWQVAVPLPEDAVVEEVIQLDLNGTSGSFIDLPSGDPIPVDSLGGLGDGESVTGPSVMPDR